MDLSPSDSQSCSSLTAGSSSGADSPDTAPSPVATFPANHSIDSVMAEACAEVDSPSHSASRADDLTFVAQVRELSVDSLMEFARPFLKSQASTVSVRTLTDADNDAAPEGGQDGDAFGPLVEDYFQGGATASELGPEAARQEVEKAIDVLKERILRLSPDSPLEQEQRAQMVQELIMLRLRIQEMEEAAEVGGGSATIGALGHQLKKVPLLQAMRQKKERLGAHCEVCGQMMILTSSQLQCIRCGYCCHRRCIGTIARSCVADEAEKQSGFILDICPEKGLEQQNYACAECRKPFPMDNPGVWESSIRVCDYNGAYYCTICHRNDQAVNPARAVKNWDLSGQPVCRASQQLLSLLHYQPLIRLLDVNRELALHVEELAYVEQLRPRLTILHRMMLDCQQAPQIALLRLLPSHRKHLMFATGLYSLQDLLDIQRGVLARHLDAFYKQLEAHVRLSCPSCGQLSQVCVYCWQTEDKLYAFQEHVTGCAGCGALAHRSCARIGAETARQCPNCRPPN
ncbi:differentially expressed in FDCP 8 homolog A-like [Paramacrobiotus metropolitanus]|uniref:differentially expressed in FDCP 8 homolog A-like n=1 Tax=Paramacrobiotus metropolitanus TaxID=2943436 RepID=UPI002445FD9B|nr:differentially expressed in FDCP 8 homolog A-like [Paramacrobiotus metropolitanus]